MMSEPTIKRYGVAVCDEYPLCSPMVKDEKGDYVLYEDVRKLIEDSDKGPKRSGSLITDSGKQMLREAGFEVGE